MPRPPSTRVRKNYRLDPASLARAQAALGTATETDTIEQALRLVLAAEPNSASGTPAPLSGTGKGILAFAGALPERDAEEMLAAIEEGCEQVDE